MSSASQAISGTMASFRRFSDGVGLFVPTIRLSWEKPGLTCRAFSRALHCRVSRPIAWTCALDGATAQQTKASKRPERYEADEIDFALRNISGNTQLLASMRRAWPSRTASRSQMHDRYWRVEYQCGILRDISDLGKVAPTTRWSHAHLACSRSTGLALVYRADLRGPSR
jgi:hypothetical protein